MTYPLSVIPGFSANKPGIHLGTKLGSKATEQEIAFVKQLGVEWVTTYMPEPSDHNAENYRRIKERFAQYGLQIYRIQNPRGQNVPEIILGLPGRDERIAEFAQYLRDLGEAGIYHATYAHQANGIWRTGREALRGGATHVGFRLEQAGAARGSWGGASWEGEFTHGRAFREEELWDAYAYFIERVVPVAEEAGVYVGVHPDDPPVYPLGGVPRCIFGSFEGFQRAVEMADSPNWGMSICVGTWLEGGEAIGADVCQAIRHFGAQKKLFHVHFRNVTAPLPEGFCETFLDDGYMDMYRVMEALHDVGFDGVVISDHLPDMVGGYYAAEAFAIGYMRALVQALER
jgi:mannonate dehydratase